MSNRKLGEDCCGDRTVCNTTCGCPCGCGLYYCRSCYADHVVVRALPESLATIARLTVDRDGWRARAEAAEKQLPAPTAYVRPRAYDCSRCNVVTVPMTNEHVEMEKVDGCPNCQPG